MTAGVQKVRKILTEAITIKINLCPVQLHCIYYVNSLTEEHNSILTGKNHIQIMERVMAALKNIAKT